MYFNDGSLGTGNVNVGEWLLRTGLANLALFVMFIATENLRPILYKLRLPTKKKLQCRGTARRSLINFISNQRLAAIEPLQAKILGNQLAISAYSLRRSIASV